MTRTTMARFATRQALTRRTKLDEMMHSAVQSADEPEAIHDVRVAIRRFTQCLRAFAEFFDPARVKRIRKRLRKILKRAGAVRNYDIALHLLKEVEMHEGPLVAKLEAKRMVAQRQFAERLQDARNWKAFESWTASGRGPGRKRRLWNPNRTVLQNARTVLPKLASELFAAGSRAAAPGAHYDTMHRFRLLGKRFRYTLELFESAYGKDFAKGLDELKLLQDKLGDVNDCVASTPLLKGHGEARLALNRLRMSRVEEFREHWKQHFNSPARAWWRGWLSRPGRRAKSTRNQSTSAKIQKLHGNLHTEARRSPAA